MTKCPFIFRYIGFYWIYSNFWNIQIYMISFIYCPILLYMKRDNPKKSCNEPQPFSYRVVAFLEIVFLHIYACLGGCVTSTPGIRCATFTPPDTICPIELTLSIILKSFLAIQFLLLYGIQIWYPFLAMRPKPLVIWACSNPQWITLPFLPYGTLIFSLLLLVLGSPKFS